MISIRPIEISTSEFEKSTNQIVLSARGPLLSDDETDSMFSPQGEVFGSLGVCGRPYDADSNGAVEGFITLQDQVIGLRDPRVGKNVYGEMAPGDTALFSTHPSESVRLLLKGQERQAALVVDKPNGKQMGFNFSGKEESVYIFGNGCSLSFNKDGSFSLLSKQGYGVVTDSQGAWVKGSSIRLGQGKKPMNTLTTPILTGTGNLGAPVAVPPMPLSGFPSYISV